MVVCELEEMLAQFGQQFLFYTKLPNFQLQV